MPSRTTVEWAVRKIVVAISSAIEARPFATIWSVTGSTIAAPLEDERAGGGIAPDRPAGRHDHGRVVLVHEHRAALRLGPERHARPDGRVHRAVADAHRPRRSRPRRLALDGERLRRRRLAERREPHGADLDRR